MQTLLSQPLIDTLKTSVKQTVTSLVDRGTDPQLAVILVGNHPDSLRYISIKSKMAKELGIIVSIYHLEEHATYKEVEETIAFLNMDPEIHGIIMQLPLPEQFSVEQTDQLLHLISDSKDVDGLGGAWEKQSASAYRTADLQAATAAFLPPMIAAVLSLLDYYDISPADKRTVLVGKGRLVGRPLELYLQKLGFDVASVDEETEHILDVTKTADILISGTGEKDLITYQWIKPDTVVIDCAQDVHEDSVSQIAAALAPSKGGVGPLTVLWLLHNTTQASLNQENAQ